MVYKYLAVITDINDKTLNVAEWHTLPAAKNFVRYAGKRNGYATKCIIRQSIYGDWSSYIVGYLMGGSNRWIYRRVG